MAVLRPELPKNHARETKSVQSFLKGRRKPRLFWRAGIGSQAPSALDPAGAAASLDLLLR